MPRYFKKQITGNIVYHNGVPIKWDMVGTETGVRVFDENQDAAIIAELDALADAKRKGVVRISSEIAASLKKKVSLAPFGSRPGALQKLRVHNPEAAVPKPPSPSVASPADIKSPTRPSPVPSVATAMGRQAEPPPVVEATTPAVPTTEPVQPVKFKPRKAKKSEVEAKIAEQDKKPESAAV